MPLHHGGFVRFLENICSTVFIHIKLFCIFPLEHCLPVGYYHRFDRTINQNHCKRENKKQKKTTQRDWLWIKLMTFFVLWKGRSSECPHLFGCNWASKGQDRCAVFRNLNLFCDMVHKPVAKYENRTHFGASSMHLYFLQKQKIFFVLLTFHTRVAVALQQSEEPSLRDVPGCCLLGWDSLALQKPGQMGCHLMRDSILLGFRGAKRWRWSTESSWHTSSAAGLCYSKWGDDDQPKINK